MKPSRLLLAAAIPLLGACASTPEGGRGAAATFGHIALEHPAGIVGARSARAILQGLGMWSGEYMHAGLAAYALYDPFAPTWQIRASALGDDTVAFQLTMKRLATGGEGEARQVFLRNARLLVSEGGYAGFDVLRYEEGVESTRPFARRVASGEIRLVGSRQFPTLDTPHSLELVQHDGAASD